ncbi:MAG: hypothetical protein KGM47_00710, partial [Acidobacteriota bacterium]|nr:hypothetical protein [Acidobacteriota bacterium]
MPFYVVEPSSLKLDLACERSPLTAVVADIGAAQAIPAALREAAFQIISRDASVLAEVTVPEGCDAAILWAAGDELLPCNAASIRLMLCRSGRRTLAPVHLNRKPGHEFDLVGLEPRIFTNLPAEDCVQSNIRIRRAASAHWSGHNMDSSQHWVRILRALQAGVKNPEAGIDRLTRLWHKSAFLPPVYGALLVRNLIVLSIWMGQFRRVQPLLSAGMDRFPLYAELPFLAGWMALQQGRLCEARRFAEQAIENPSPEFVGSGGEGSFRSAWLVARAAEIQGDQATAVTGYMAGIDAMPAFPPSVHGLLNQRVDARTAELLSIVALPGLARREPQYTGEIFDFCVKHQKLEAARRILELPQLAEETRASLELRLREAHSSLSPRRRQPRSRAGVVLTGPFWVHSSLARINRELGAVLAGSDEIEAGFDQHGLADVPGNLLPHFEAISKG